MLAAISRRATAQADPEKPVTPPDSYRVVMENDRMRMIEIHIKARSKVNVDSPAGRDRFLYMLSDGALVLAPPGKTPYEFALHAGETAVFPAVSPTVENDTDSAGARPDGRDQDADAQRRGRRRQGQIRQGQVARARRRQIWQQSSVCSGKPSVCAASRVSPAASPSAARSQSQSQSKSKVAKQPQPQASATSVANAPLNLRNANARPAKKVTGKRRGSDG